MPQEKFRQAMPGSQEIRADILSTAQQIARRFFLIGRDTDGGQGPGAIEDRQAAGIATIRLDAVSGATRDQRRRNYLTRNAFAREGAL